MRINRTSTEARSTEKRTLLKLYAFDAMILIALICAYKTGSLLPSPATPLGIVFAASLLSAVGLVWSIYCDYRRPVSAFWPSVAVNLIVVVTVLVLSEATLRIVANKTPSGIYIGDWLLPPTWDELRSPLLEIADEAAGRDPWSNAFLVYDRTLGWVAGPDRRSRPRATRSSSIVVDYSSAESIRAPRAGIRFRGLGADRLIAVVGDSYAYGLDVDFEESWADRLDQALGPAVRVLNFAVSGYGLDQAFLRYMRDVKPWNPNIVILGFVQDDLIRSMVVYPFITYPGWEMPFAKPRFILNAGQLELLNTPLIELSEILRHRTMHDLPFVEYDFGYVSGDWAMRIDNAPFIFRFFTAVFPRWKSADARTGPESWRAVNRQLLRKFVREAHSESSIPMVVYFPTAGAGDFNDARRTGPEGQLARSVLHDSGIDFVDLTDCVSSVPDAERIIADRVHYSPAANLAVARCLEAPIRRSLKSAN